MRSGWLVAGCSHSSAPVLFLPTGLILETNLEASPMQGQIPTRALDNILGKNSFLGRDKSC